MAVRVSLQGVVLLVSLGRPQVRNCVSPEVARELYRVFSEFEKGPAKVAVLHGKDYFCAGFDLDCLADPTAVPPLTEARGPMGVTRLRLSKPVIAAVEGFAVAEDWSLRSGVTLLWLTMKLFSECFVEGSECH